MARVVSTRLLRLSPAVFLLLLVTVAPVAGQGLALAGHYAIAHDVTWTGDQVVLTMSVELVNESEGRVQHAAVVLERPNAPIDEALTPEWTVATFGPRDLEPGARLRLSQQLTIPGDVWGSWQQEKPAFRVTFYDDVAGETSQRVFLAETGEIALER